MGIKNADFNASFESVKKCKKLMRKTLSAKTCQKNWVLCFYYCVTQKFFCFYQHFLLTLKPNADETAQKTKNVLYKCVLQSHFTSNPLIVSQDLTSSETICYSCDLSTSRSHATTCRPDSSRNKQPNSLTSRSAHFISIEGSSVRPGYSRNTPHSALRRPRSGPVAGPPRPRNFIPLQKSV